MARVRKIRKGPLKSKRNYFLVDSNFLAEKYLPVGSAPTEAAKQRIRDCQAWWREIDRQIDNERARAYVPDICIAEAFKVLAKKYYKESAFASSQAFKRARDRLQSDVSISHKVLKAQHRHIRYHDLPATRDIIIAVDRFYELFMKNDCNVSIADLILVASAKYLMDFHDAEKSQLHIITLDKALRRGTKKIAELPNAYDPPEQADSFDRVFE